MSDSQWVDELIGKLEDAVTNKKPIKFNDAGKEVLVEIKNEVVDLVKENRNQLIKIGRQVFKRFLLLMHKQHEFEALTVIYEKLDNSELLDRYKEDSARLAELATETQESRDFWIGFGKKVGMRIVLGALGALL